MQKIATDSLGFAVRVAIVVGALPVLGRHATYETEAGEVTLDCDHKICIDGGLGGAELAEVVSHEVYHLFYSVRNLITADEETQCEVFGQLVKHIVEIVESQ